MQPSQPNLARVLGLWMATAIVVGTVIGSGVFKKARNVAENAPEFGLGISVWVLGGVLTLFGSLLFIITLPFVVLAVVSEPAHPPRVEHLTPAWPGDWLGVNWGLYGAALVGVLWAYNGWMNLGPVAEEIKEPRRNIPLGLLL